MIDYIVLGVIAVVVVAAVMYIVKAKKKGVKCIGCSSAGKCAHKEHNDCSCK